MVHSCRAISINMTWFKLLCELDLHPMPCIVEHSPEVPNSRDVVRLCIVRVVCCLADDLDAAIVILRYGHLCLP